MRINEFFSRLINLGDLARNEFKAFILDAKSSKYGYVKKEFIHPSIKELDYYETSGSDNAYILTPDPAVVEYEEGQSWLIKANHTNTGPSTLNVSGTGVRSIKKNVDGVLSAGDIQEGGVYVVADDGVNFQLTIPVLPDIPVFQDLILSSRVLESPTYKTIGNLIDSNSAGVLEMGNLVGSDIVGTVDVPVGKGFIKVTDDEMAVTKFFDWDAQANVALTEGINYLYVDYNNGSPIINTSGSFKNINGRTQFCIGCAYRKGNTVEIIQRLGVNISDFIHKAWRRLEHRLLELMSGAIVSEVKERYLGVSASVYYRGYTELEFAAIDTSGLMDSYTAVYKDGAGGWTYEAELQQFSNVLYDDGDGIPGEVGVAKYATYYVYQCMKGKIYIQYGQGGSNNLTLAQNEEIPISPDYLAKCTLLRAKIIVLRGATHAESIENYANIMFRSFVAGEHNVLGGLQGGKMDEYYHFTEVEHRELQEIKKLAIAFAIVL